MKKLQTRVSCWENTKEKANLPPTDSHSPTYWIHLILRGDIIINKTTSTFR